MIYYIYTLIVPRVCSLFASGQFYVFRFWKTTFFAKNNIIIIIHYTVVIFPENHYNPIKKLFYMLYDNI